MNIKILDYTSKETMLEAAGVCRNAINKQTALYNALDIGHDSLMEFWNISVKVTGVSRTLLAQLTRHRMASFAVQSQRHVKIEGENWYITPQIVTPKFHTIMQLLKQQYEELIADGYTLEDARYILPNATKTNLILAINGRSLDNFFTLRCCNNAQYEIRQFAKKLLYLCRSKTHIFNKQYPDCEHCKHSCKYKKTD